MTDQVHNLGVEFAAPACPRRQLSSCTGPDKGTGNARATHLGEPPPMPATAAAASLTTASLEFPGHDPFPHKGTEEILSL